jgi:hypothetical protein
VISFLIGLRVNHPAFWGSGFECQRGIPQFCRIKTEAILRLCFQWVSGLGKVFYVLIDILARPPPSPFEDSIRLKSISSIDLRDLRNPSETDLMN